MPSMEAVAGALNAQPQVIRRVFSLADAAASRCRPVAPREDDLARQNEQLKAENEALRTRVVALELQLRQRLTPQQAIQAILQKCTSSDVKVLERTLLGSLEDGDARGGDSAGLGAVDFGEPEPANVASPKEAASATAASATATLSPRMSTVPSEATVGFGDRANKRQRITLQTARDSGEMEATAGPLAGATPTENRRAGSERVARLSSYQSDEFDSDGDSSSSENDEAQTRALTATRRSRPRVPVVTYGWKLPLDLTFAAYGDCWAQPPRLSISSFAQLDSARPWDLIFDRRPRVSYIYNYQTLGKRARRWVRSIQWFQFSFRRELWDWAHWINMEERPDDGEWEAYRQFRAQRIAKVLEAWEKIGAKVAKLVSDRELPDDIWLDPSIWYFSPDERLTWQHSSSNLVREQAKEDLWHPARCFYVRNIRDHPFFKSDCESKYPEECSLPPLVSPDRKYEVQVIPVDGNNANGAVMCPTSWGTTEFAPQYVVVPHKTNS